MQPAMISAGTATYASLGETATSIPVNSA